MRRSLRVLSLGGGIKMRKVSDMRFEEIRFLGVSCDIPRLPVKLEKLDKLKVFQGPFYSSEGEPILSQLPSTVKSMLVNTGGIFDSGKCTISLTIEGAPVCSSLEKLQFSINNNMSWEAALLKILDGFNLLPKIPYEFNEDDFNKLVAWKGLILDMLERMTALPKMPNGFNQLVALKVLVFDRMERMTELPEQICELPALKILSMRECSKLQSLPESLGRLTTLESLDLSGCRGLSTLPRSIGQLTASTKVNMVGCPALQVLQRKMNMAKQTESEAIRVALAYPKLKISNLKLFMM